MGKFVKEMPLNGKGRALLEERIAGVIGVLAECTGVEALEVMGNIVVELALESNDPLGVVMAFNECLVEGVEMGGRNAG